MIEKRISRGDAELIFIGIQNNKISASHFNEENSKLSEIMVPLVSHLDPQFSTTLRAT